MSLCAKGEDYIEKEHASAWLKHISNPSDSHYFPEIREVVKDSDGFNRIKGIMPMFLGKKTGLGAFVVVQFFFYRLFFQVLDHWR
jgi:hypothetical protein